MQEHGWKTICGRHDISERDIAQVINEEGTIGCCVRNPYDVFISWYYHGVVSNAVRTKRYGCITPFEKWLPSVLRAGNGYIERGLFYGSKYCDTILRYENLATELNAWFESFGHPPVVLGFKGKATARNDRAYQTYYNEQTRKDVCIYCAKELEEFGYDFDPDGEFHLTDEGYYSKIQ